MCTNVFVPWILSLYKFPVHLYANTILFSLSYLYNIFWNQVLLADPNFVFFFLKILTYHRFFSLLEEFYNNQLATFYIKYLWEFGWKCIESMDQLGGKWHLHVPLFESVNQESKFSIDWNLYILSTISSIPIGSLMTVLSVLSQRKWCLTFYLFVKYILYFNLLYIIVNIQTINFKLWTLYFAF